jgi:Tfp pilus assembly protein PilE
MKTAATTRRRRPNGFTAVELITAMVVTTALGVGIFVAYVNIYKIFVHQTRQAQEIRDAVVASTRMDALFRDMTTIEQTTPTDIRFRSARDTAVHTLRFANKDISLDKNVIVRQCGKFSFSLTPVRESDKRALLVWDATLVGTRWIGGATIVSGW